MICKLPEKTDSWQKNQYFLTIPNNISQKQTAKIANMYQNDAMKTTSNSVGSGPARILIVDDHPNTASMLARALERSADDLDVKIAHSGEEAFELIEENIIDVLITDFILPGISGLELIRKIRREITSGPEYIILMTAYGSTKLTEAVRYLHINDYLVKPVSPEKIESIIGTAIEGMQTTSPAMAEATTDNPFTILVADDNVDNLRLLTKRLARDGYQFVTAADGEEVMQLLRSEAIDLLLLDVNMPKKDGFQVLEEVRSDPELQYTPVIMITAARIDSRDIRTGLSLGADDYVTKPFDWRELIVRVRTKLRVKQFEDSLRRRNYQLSMLPEIGQDLSGCTDVDEIAELLLDRTSRVLDAAAAHLVFTSGAHPQHRFHHNRDSILNDWEIIQGQLKASSYFNRIADRRAGDVVEDTLADARWSSEINATMRAVICVPLLGQREVIGVFSLFHELEGHFDDESLTFLRAIASQAAIAIEDAQLYTRERKRANELSALHLLTQELSGINHFDELIDRFPESIQTGMNYPFVALWEAGQNQPQLICQAGEEQGFDISELVSCPVAVFEQGHAVLLNPLGAQASSNGIHTNGHHAGVAVPVHTNGELAYVLAVYSQQRDQFDDGDQVVLEMLAAQISATLERIRLFESVEKEQNRLSAVLQAAADAILVFDREGNLQLINPAAHKLFTDVDTTIGRPLPLKKGYDDLLEMLSMARKADNTEQGKILWPDQRTFAVLITPVEEGGQVVVLHDVSQFVDLERVKNEFIAMVSHDLKNPIGAVLGFSDLMEKAGPLNEEQKDFVGRIRHASGRMHELVLNMLELIRIDLGVELTLMPVDLHDLLSSVNHDIQAQARAKEQELIVELPQGRPQVLGSVSRLRQVLYNLIGNAIKYSPPGGQISVEVDQEGSKIWISISDTGYGIPSEDLPFIFDKFYRAYLKETKDIEGNGLGLTIVKAIVEQHKGEIEVESVLDEGSTFRFSLTQLPDDIAPFSGAEKRASEVSSDA